MINNELIESIKESFIQNRFIHLQGAFDEQLTNFLELIALYDYKVNKKNNNVENLQNLVDDKQFNDVDTIYDSICGRALQTFVQNFTRDMLPVQLVPTYAKQYVISRNNGFVKNTIKPNTEYTAYVITDSSVDLNVNNNKLTLVRGDILIIDNKFINYEMSPTNLPSVNIFACNFVDGNNLDNEQYFYDGDKTKGGVIRI